MSLYDRAGMSTSTSGTGALTLGAALGAVPPNLCSWQSFATAGVTNGATVSYLIVDANGAFEFGHGTYSSAGPTLTRTTVIGSSNAGSAINVTGSGTQVFLSALAEDIVTGVTSSTGYIAVTSAAGVVTLSSPVTVYDAAALGFVGDGVTANDTAFNNWWNSLPTQGGILQFPVGKFLFNSAISKTMANARSSITLRGAGQDGTILYFPSTNGISITQASLSNTVHVHDLTISCATVGTKTGLVLNGISNNGNNVNNSTIQNVKLCGDDLVSQGGADYWSTAVTINDWSGVTLFNVNTYGLFGSPGSAGGGTGLFIQGNSGSGYYCTLINVIACSFNYHVYGIELGSYWQGIIIRDCNFNGEVGTSAIYYPPSQTGTQVLLNILGCQFNWGGFQITLQSGGESFTIADNTITVYGNSNVGLYGSSTSLGNFFVNTNVFNLSGAFTGTTAIVFIGNLGIIMGNTFTGLATGVNLNSQATNTIIALNRYNGVTTNTANTSGTGNAVGTITS